MIRNKFLIKNSGFLNSLVQKWQQFKLNRVNNGYNKSVVNVVRCH